MKPPHQIRHQPEGTQGGEERRQQEARPYRSRERDRGGGQPDEYRRLVRIEFARAPREPELPGLQHFLGNERESRLVRRPGVAQADADCKQAERRDEQPGQGSRCRVAQGDRRSGGASGAVVHVDGGIPVAGCTAAARRISIRLRR
jgi:hypothetical protein